MDLGIVGKRALVLGGTSGLGLACSEALAAEGVDLVLFSRGQERNERVQADLAARFSVRTEAVRGDLTKPDEVRRLAAHVEQSGGVDILVLNTPRPPSPMRAFLDETEDDRWDEAYRNQLHTALHVLRAIAPIIITKGWGRIIGITSASVKRPMANHALSTVFRAGVEAALKHLVTEVGPYGVTVNAVAPATVVTPTFAQFHNLEARIQATPLRRCGELGEVGGTVAFLASQQAGFITGQVVQVDGGLTASLG